MHSKKKAFTLVEILVVIGVVAVASVAALLILNPVELLKKSRDSSRILDMNSLNVALNTFASSNPDGFFGLASTTYVSLVGNDASCSNLGLPALPAGYSYQCVTSTSVLRDPDGTGWLPVDFTKTIPSSLVDELPIDPVNSTSGLYYTYSSPGKTWAVEMTSVLESNEYSPLMAKDGGISNSLYEVGSNINLSSQNHIPSGPSGQPMPVLSSISPSSISVGAPAFTLIARGLNFFANSIINWNGSARTTTYVTSTELTAGIFSTDLISSGTIPITVSNPGDGTSGSKNFNIYQFTPAQGWSTDSSSGSGQGQGNSIVEVNGVFYILAGSGKSFQRYDALSKTWTNMSQVPQSVNNGAVLVKYDNDTLYATRGSDTTDFWQYKISTDTWTAKASVPQDVNTGGALAYPGSGDYIYLFQGDGTNKFWRYSIGGDSWTAMTDLPFTVQNGGAMTALDADDIYAFAGNSNLFYKYKISTLAWTAKGATPLAVGNGGSLTNDGANIYALRGADTTTFWKYVPLNDAWTQLSSTTIAVGISDGNARGGLAYSQFLNAIYATPGLGNSIMKLSSL